MKLKLSFLFKTNWPILQCEIRKATPIFGSIQNKEYTCILQAGSNSAQFYRQVKRLNILDLPVLDQYTPK